MPQIGLRVSEELLETVDRERGVEESRSEFIRRAIRRELAEPSRADRIEDRLEDHESRLEALESRLEDHADCAAADRVDRLEDRLEDLEETGWLGWLG